LFLCVNTINSVFGKYFSLLLPGCEAELALVGGECEYPRGCVFRVRLRSETCKDIFTLSGGQQTILAFSFLMSLLYDHSSPFYLLDEIDSNLDLEHALSLSCFIRESSKQSQFVIISLRDGVFTNADVLFLTKIEKGCSRVFRRVFSKELFVSLVL